MNDEPQYKVTVRWHGVMIIKACVWFAAAMGMEIDNVKLWKTLRALVAFRHEVIDDGR